MACVHRRVEKHSIPPPSPTSSPSLLCRESDTVNYLLVTAHFKCCLTEPTFSTLNATADYYRMAAITCHVIDTCTNRPAAGMQVLLRCFCFSSYSNRSIVKARTTSDGAVTQWYPVGEDLEYMFDRFVPAARGHLDTVWQMRFDSGNYFGQGNTYWPFVNVDFHVQSREQLHITLYIGPYEYKAILPSPSSSKATRKLRHQLPPYSTTEVRAHSCRKPEASSCVYLNGKNN